MIDILSEFSLLWGLLCFLLIFIAFSLAIYIGAARYFQANLSKEHQRLGRVLFRVAASLLALVLSFSFANQRVSYFQVKSTLESEAAKIVDIHVDLELIGTQEALGIQVLVRDYIKEIVSSDWVPLFDNPFETAQFKTFRKIYESVNKMEAENEYQSRLKENILKDLDEMSDLLQLRAYSTITSSSPLLYTSFLGIFITMALLGVYTPDRKSIVIATLYIIFIGTLLYFVLMMSNPLRGPLQLDPGPFKILQESVERRY